MENIYLRSEVFIIALCCLFNNQKEYAYKVRVFANSYEAEIVLVKKCEKCKTKKIKCFSPLSSNHEKFLADSLQDILDISKLNGIPLLKDVK